MTATLLSPEALVAAAQIAREETLEQYYDLGRRVAHGESVDAQEISRIATAAGMSIDENPSAFLSLVERFKFRRRLREKLSRLEPCEREMKETRAAVDKENQILEEHVQIHQRVTAPLQVRLRELRAEYGDASSVSSDLIASCPIPSLKNKSRALQAHIEQVSFALGQARDKAVEHHGRSKATRDKSERIHAERMAIEADGVVKKMQQEIERLQAEQAANTAKIIAV